MVFGPSDRCEDSPLVPRSKVNLCILRKCLVSRVKHQQYRLATGRNYVNLARLFLNHCVRPGNDRNIALGVWDLVHASTHPCIHPEA